MRDYFEGYYFKHQKGKETLCLIVGQSGEDKFIQVITNDFSMDIPLEEGNFFSKKGIRLNIDTPQLTLKGKISYGKFSPIKYDIMGPFILFSMECRHGIISMKHALRGEVNLNGKTIDFTGGTGYIEKDSGYSFPSSYVWIQANDFEQPCSVMAAVADIPFLGFHFRGCICVIQYQGKEYRLATYLGVRVRLCTQEKIILTQGKYRLEIEVKSLNAHSLSAPIKGKMTRTISEAAACPARFRFYCRKNLIFDLKSEGASFEYEK